MWTAATPKLKFRRMPVYPIFAEKSSTTFFPIFRVRLFKPVIGHDSAPETSACPAPITDFFACCRKQILIITAHTGVGKIHLPLMKFRNQPADFRFVQIAAKLNLPIIDPGGFDGTSPAAEPFDRRHIETFMIVLNRLR